MATINGTDGNDVLTGTADSDTIYALGGDDVIDGVVGTDFLYGGDGNDRFIFSGVRFTNPAPPIGIIDGGAGFDEIDVSDLSPASIYSNRLSIGNQQFDLFGIERVKLGFNDQYVSGLNIPFEIVSGAGNDNFSLQGSATVNSGAGNDYFFISPQLVSGSGAAFTMAVLDGGSGIDTLATNILAEVDLQAGTAKVWNATYSISGFENVIVPGYGTNTTVRGDAGANRISENGSGSAGVFFDGRGGDDVLTGSKYADTLRGGEGSDRIAGLAGADFIFGDAGNDIIDALADGDTIDGGSGFDVVNYTGLTRGYDVSSGNMTASVAGNGSVDRITAVEAIDFRDATLTFEVESNAAYVMRLYDAILHREPDAVGLDAWLDRMDAGLSKTAVAAAFVGSPEFVQLTGSLSTPDFVEFLYTSALGRPSDAQGKADWVARIDSGMSRADAVIGFSESAEHRIKTEDTLAKGLWVTDDNFQQVAALYDSFANRLPDREGLLHWVESLEAGASLESIASGFANSAEFSQATSGMSNGDLVEYMYLNTLDRGSDASGKQAWVSALEGGMTKGELLLGFSASEEHFMVIQDHIYSGIDVLG